MEIGEIQGKVRKEEYEISFHAEKERYYDGEILEDYPDDPRGSSCLVLGYSQNRPIHIVCGYTFTKWIRIITVYIPRLPKWIDERTRSRGDEKDA